MVSSTRQAIAGILFVLIVSVCARAQTTPAKDSTATISGKITIKNKGAPGILVALRKDNETYADAINYRAVTDEDGEYRIVNVAPGSYVVMPVAPAFVSSMDRDEKSLIVNKGEMIEHVDFTLTRGGVITGKVLDADGRPVIEEEVYVIPVRSNDRPYYVGNVLTDDRGVYRFFGLRANSYRVGVGRDEGGSFRGRSHNSFKRTYYPSASDIAQATTIDVAEGSETTNIDISLTRALTTYTASGRVVDAETGQPVPNLEYGITQFVSPNNTSGWNNGAVTNAGGEFKFDGLLPGKYAISIVANRGNNWRADPARFEVTDQDIGGLLLKATKGATISGVVVLEGTDDKSVRDQLSRIGVAASMAEASMADSMWSSSGRIQADGSFQIVGLRGGLVNLFLGNDDRFRLVRVEQNGVIQSRGIELKDGQQLTGVRVVVQYANASLHGTIDVENGPLPESGQLFVNISKPGEDDRTMSIRNSRSRVDARGQFVIEWLLPGNYELTVGVFIPGSPPTMINKKQEVVVTAGASTSVNVKLDLKSNTRPD
jgi:protocatechuate 3,4-dioxygenase beta subunit